MGPVRLTFTQKGVSKSLGVPGYRITKRADGKIQETINPLPGVYKTNIVIPQEKQIHKENKPKQKGSGLLIIGGLIALGVLLAMLPSITTMIAVLVFFTSGGLKKKR